jgi:hypothetical protein
MLHPIKMWLKVPVAERDENGKPRVSGGKGSSCGTPQGGVITVEEWEIFNFTEDAHPIHLHLRVTIPGYTMAVSM